MEEEDVLPMPHMRGSDAEAGCGERSRSEDAQRHPLGERAELLEDDVVPRALRVDGDERESRATTQPNDHACDMKRHEQAVASHLVSSVNSPTARIFISLPPPAFSASESPLASARGLLRESRSRRALESAKARAEWPVVCLFGLSDERGPGLFFRSPTLRDVSKRDHGTAAVLERNWGG